MRRRGKPGRDIETYAHADKERANNPPVGLVTPETDRDAGRKTYAHDPHLDPQLSWAGKAEHTSFDVPTVSLHVHERIDPRTIVEAVRKRRSADPQPSLFAMPEENPPLRQAIEFHKHRHNWTNRLIAGDSLLVMNSLFEKESLGGKVQTVYIDPPYGIRYGSNFQPFVNRCDVTDGRDEDLTGEPEQIRAFRDTWEIGIHSYLAYLRDRLLLARELLHESGSCFMQIGDEYVHRVGMVMDEVFGAGNRMATISYATTGASSTMALSEKAGQRVSFARLEPLPGTRWLHAVGETQPDDTGADGFRGPATAYDAVRVVVSFGPDHAPLEQRQVSRAVEEAQLLAPKPRVIVFAAFQFDPEAAKDIDETHWPGVTLLKAQMNADLLTDDLKKKRAGNESFWLIGQPDVTVERVTEGDDKGGSGSQSGVSTTSTPGPATWTLVARTGLHSGCSTLTMMAEA